MFVDITIYVESIVPVVPGEMRKHKTTAYWIYLVVIVHWRVGFSITKEADIGCLQIGLK